MDRGDTKENGLLAGRLAESPNGELLHGPQPTMRNAQAVRRRSRREVPLLHQGNPEAPETRVPGDRGAVNTATNDQEIEIFALEPAQVTSHLAAALL